MRLVVLADTHLRDGTDRDLPEPVWAAVRASDGVLHAGDVVGADLLERLAATAPVWAVLGNNDHGLAGRLPSELVLDLEGVTVAMIHDSGARSGRERRMARHFPQADVVVFGHSHDPVDAEGVDGQRLFNPGSPTQRRRQPHPSYGVLVLEQGLVRDHRIVLL